MKSNKSEKEIEKEIKDYLEYDLFSYIIKQHGSAFTKPGVPDLTVCINGCFVGIEVKSAKGKLSDAQAVHIRKIRAAGGVAFAVRSLEGCIKALKKYKIIKED